MKITFRTLHRDLGYFYVGLIIVFSISGLFLNHRENWYPLNYEYQSEQITVPAIDLNHEMTQNDIKAISAQLNIIDKVERFGMENNTIWVSYKNADLEFNKHTGKGRLKKFMTTPVLGQMTMLHIDTNKFWIYYSDLFAISLLLIAVSAIIFPKGKYSFVNYGWKLSLAGLAVPLIVIFFLF